MNDNNYKYLIIDAQNLFWRCFTVALKKYLFEESKDIFPGAIKEFISQYERLKKKFYKDNDCETYLLFDNPESTLNQRKLFDANYKSLRFKKSAPRGLYATLKLLYQLLQCYDNNLYLISMESFEADDITYPLIQKLNIDKNNQCLCISNDLDWARNIELKDNVEWYNFTDIYTKEFFNQKYKFYPDGNKIKLWKTLIGDKSDGIKKAVPYVKNDIILDIVNNCNKVRDIFVYVSGQKEKYGNDLVNKILDAKDKILLNYQLVDFILIEEDINKYSIECKRNIKALKFWYNILELEIESWMETKQSVANNFLSKKKKIIKFIN